MISLESSLTDILESLGDALIVVDASGRPVRWSSVAERLLGKVEPVLVRALAGEEVTGLEISVELDGSVVLLATSTRILRDASGVLTGVVAIFRDVTEARRAERALREMADLRTSVNDAPSGTTATGPGGTFSERKKLEEHLVLTDRMVSIGTLAAGVAHEINNPLAYMTMNLESLGQQLRALVADTTRTTSTQAAEMLELTNEVRGGAERIRKIVRGMKAFSRPEISESSPQDLARVADAAIQIVDNELRHRARIVRVFGPTPMVDADEAGLSQVLVNLLANAAHAIPEGDAANNEVRVSLSTSANGEAILEVADTGSGISPAILPRIFDPFFTTHALEAGTGLGLSISHGIVTLLGGTLSVTSEVGRGSVFRITLPPSDGRHSGPGGIALKAPATSAVPPRRQILIIDDDEIVGRALARTLRADHDLTILTKAKDAEELLARVDFDFILCDLMMPNMSGMELHASIMRTRPDLARRFVFLTGGAFTAAAREFLDGVKNERFDKPVNIGALREFLRGPLASTSPQ